MEQIKDLLSETVSLKPVQHLASEYNYQIILITGAAGSIGSEIAKQLLVFNYKKLILIDIAESALYDLQQAFEKQPTKNIDFVVADVRDKTKMNYIFETYKPTIIFHTAAYKHVPLMESDPYEAIRLNVFGTKLLADLAISYITKKFVFVSSDKAVNPINIMGATKRIAELYLGHLSQNTQQTTFYVTRFGNILRSNGSVIPLFKRQVESGGPLTVTHLDASRYFISIAKASQLILEAASMTYNTITYTFNMGKPVKIMDLAKTLIALANKEFTNKIDIEITGLRIGEKLSEDMVSKDEKLTATNHKDILLVTSKTNTVNEIELKIPELLQITPYSSNPDVVSRIKSIIPEYLSKP